MAAVCCSKLVRVSGRGTLRDRGDESGPEAILAGPVEGGGPRALSGLWFSVAKRSRKSRGGTPLVPAISSVFESGFVLSFARGDDGDLAVLVSLPEARQTMYEMRPWPMIMEFRSMLEAWDTSEPNSFWQGRWFYGYTVTESTVPPVWVRCPSGVTFGFKADEWGSLQEAFRRAWQKPELQRISAELMLEYGEI